MSSCWCGELPRKKSGRVAYSLPPSSCTTDESIRPSSPHSHQTVASSQPTTRVFFVAFFSQHLGAFFSQHTHLAMASTLNQSPLEPKALPPLLNKGAHLPPPPSPTALSDAPPPVPPPKSMLDAHPDSLSGSLSLDDRLSQRSQNELLSPPSIATPPPDSPSFPSDQTSAFGPPSPGLPPTNGSRPKKVNPFVDLMETEKIYVDTLSGIIRVRFRSPPVSRGGRLPSHC